MVLNRADGKIFLRDSGFVQQGGQNGRNRLRIICAWLRRFMRKCCSAIAPFTLALCVRESKPIQTVIEWKRYFSKGAT